MRTRDRIIQASIELFNEHGERQITTNHIAAYMGISPGNLYYHFRNKSDIINHIFTEYKTQLENSFIPKEASTFSVIQHSMDSAFELMWRFNFFYSNLPDILSRDEQLQETYLELQARQVQRMVVDITELKNSGVLNIPDEDIPSFVNTIKLTITFWISYLKTQPLAHTLEPSTDNEEKLQITTKIEKPMIYKGVLTVLLLLKPYLSESGKEDLKVLQTYYTDLSNQPVESEEATTEEA